MMIRIFPYGAIQFMAFDQYKKVAEFIVFLLFFFSVCNEYKLVEWVKLNTKTSVSY